MISDVIVPKSNGHRKMKVGLFEESARYGEQLCSILKKHSQVELALHERDSLHALSKVKNSESDLVFFSLESHHPTPLAVCEEILQMKKAPLLVLTSGARQYSLQALDLRAMDYLIKPFENQRVEQTVLKAKKAFEERIEAGLPDGVERRRHIICYKPHKPKERILIEASQIGFVQARHGVIYVFLPNDKEPLVTDWPMKDLLSRFTPSLFSQTHKSFLVNLDQAERLVPQGNGNYHIQIRGTESIKIPLSRRFVKHLRQKLEE
jgi:two-component system response regulator LytT